MAKANRSAASRFDLSDKVEIGLYHLSAMLNAASGGHFHELAEEIQENFLWACRDKVSEIEQAWHEAQKLIPAPADQETTPRRGRRSNGAADTSTPPQEAQQ